MRNRIANGVNQGLDNLKSVAKTGLKLAPAILAALLSTQAKATTWVCGIDIDTATDGSSMGTNYNDGSTIYALAGERGGLSFREIDNGVGGAAIEMTSDGVTFTDITANIQASDPGLATADFDLSGYNPDTDEMMIKDYDTDVYWVIADASTVGMSATELLNTGHSIGSIDRSTGGYYGSYNDGTAAESDPAVYTTTSIPSKVYTRTGDDFSPQADSANDRLFVSDSSDKTYEITGVSGGSPSRSEITGTSSAWPTFFSPNNISPSGYDELLFQSTSFRGEYCYDSDSAVATVDPDTDGDTITDSVDSCPTEDASGFDTDADGCIDDVDGDGSKADSDCDDADAGAFPGNAITYADGADNDCLDSLPAFTAMSISPSTVEVGVSATLSASARDDETASPTITWEVRNSAGTVVDTSTGSSSSFTTSTADTYTVTATATDGDGHPVSNSDTLVVSETPVTYSDLPTADGAVADGTYYEGGDPTAGSMTVAGVSIVGGVITLTGFGSSISGNGYSEIDYSVPDANVSGQLLTWFGDGVLGFMAADGDDYPYADTSDTTKMFRVTQTAGTLTAEGTFTDSEGTLELDEEFATAGTYELADIVDDPDIVDTGDADTDTDTDSDTDSDSDTDTDTDTDSDSDTDSGIDSGDSGSEDDTAGDTGTTPPGGCPGCATENGANGSWALGAVALAALGARRRRQN